MKAENTIPLDINLMTGNKESKEAIKESELCEKCKGDFYAIEYGHSISCGFKSICKNAIACKKFCKEKEHTPSYYTNIRGNYNGKDKDKMWDNVDKNKDNTVYVNDCTKFPIKSDEEYVCIFDGNAFGSNNAVANIEITGNIINMSKDIITVYNKEVKKVYMAEVGNIKCLLPKSLHEIITSLNDNK